MPDTPVTTDTPTPPARVSGPARVTGFLIVLTGIVAGVLVSLIIGGVLVSALSDLSGRVYALVKDNPVLFGLVAVSVIIGASVGGWWAYSYQNDTGFSTPLTPAAKAASAPAVAVLESNLPPPPPKSPAEMIWQGINDVFTAFLRALRALFLLVANTVTTLLPSTAFTAKIDENYSGEMLKTYQSAIQALPMKAEYKDIIMKNWLGQITWADNRATRERNVNEIIRWWQIVLGVLIPALTTANETGPVLVMSLFVAFLTGIAQFRRPDENWRHYRLLSESYQNEIWDFITLSGDKYASKDPANPALTPKRLSYDEAFMVFHQKMTQLRKDDVTSYFGDMSNTNRPRNVEELRKEFADLQQLFAITGQATPAANIQVNAEKGTASIVTESTSKSETTVTGDNPGTVTTPDTPGSAG